jgi:hypothetical protein
VAAAQTISLRHAAAVSNVFVLMLGISMAAPLLRLPQLITGSIVNATLLVTAVVLGPRAAISVGVLPSLFAVISGQLPPGLVPLVPLIMIGNTLLVIVFHLARRRGWWVGVVAASVVKFSWLFGSTTLLTLTTGLLAPPAAVLALAMMGWPQLVTALCGGGIAFAVLGPARRR